MEHSTKRRRTGKFLLLAQIPILLFSTFVFSQVKSTFSDEDQTKFKEQVEKKRGIDTSIPKPILSNESNKLTLMQKAQQDSLKKQKELEKTYGIFSTEENEQIPGLEKADQMEQKLNDLVSHLEKQQTAQNSNRRIEKTSPYSYNDYKRQKDMDDLKSMINTIENDQPNKEDAELKDVSNTMDKMIQMMEMANALDKGKSIEDLDKSMDGSKKLKDNSLEVKKTPSNLENTGGFFELNESSTNVTDNTFKASFFTEQTLLSGSTVKIKLDEDLLVNDMIIPKNTFVFGKVNLAGDRINITIRSIRYKDYLFPVTLVAYDYDGNLGIFAQGSIERSKIKKASSEAIRSADMNSYSLDRSIEDRAIESTSNFLKDIFSSKVRALKVTVKSHHKILLKNK